MRTYKIDFTFGFSLLYIDQLTNHLSTEQLKNYAAIVVTMNRVILFTTMCLLATLGTNTALGQTQPLNFTKLLEEKGNFNVFGIIAHESPKTLVLTGEIINLGQAIDIAKENGFTIDAVTVFVETSVPSEYTNTRYLTPNYTVFMSR